jgi:hypothetical protein
MPVVGAWWSDQLGVTMPPLTSCLGGWGAGSLASYLGGSMGHRAAAPYVGD